MGIIAPKFEAGQVIHHKQFGYRGVIISVDESFGGTEELYDDLASTRLSRSQPWYHILVDGSAHETYVAERNLEEDADGGPVVHPLVPIFFDDLVEGRYVRNRILN